MNIKNLTNSLEFLIEAQELRAIGLTEEEIQGYFKFDWSLGKDLITSVIKQKRDTNDQN